MNKRKRYLLKSILVLLIFVTFVLPSHTTVLASKLPFNDLSEKHWAKNAILWGYENGIVNGDQQGRFLPENKVTEAEFLAMLVRSYEKDLVVRDKQNNEKWYTPYFDLATNEQWYVYGYNVVTKRYHVANLVYSMLKGPFVSNEKSIQYLLDTGLSTGKTSATVEGYLPYDHLTRAEAIVFIQRLKSTYPNFKENTDKVKSGLLDIELGDSEADVVKALGQPNRKEPSLYSYTWYIYNKSFDRFAMIGMSKDNKVVALYSNARNVWGMDIAVGSSLYQLTKKLGNVKINISGYAQHKANGVTTNYYIDQGAGGMIDAIMMYTTDLIGSKNSNQAQVDSAFDRQIFDATNVFRHKNGLLGALSWSDKAASSAYLHSKDMYENTYMNHTNLSGQSAQDRMYAAGLRDFGGGENIAYGYETGFDVYNGWINSQGHRENLLYEHYRMLGVGSYKNYYTQNFVMPY